MVKVYNPIYDTVFKYLMEDNKSAKVLLGSILDKKIKTLDLKNNDYSIVTEGDMRIVRLDFCATIVDKKTKHEEIVTIELQKAFDEEEVVNQEARRKTPQHLRPTSDNRQERPEIHKHSTRTGIRPTTTRLW